MVNSQDVIKSKVLRTVGLTEAEIRACLGEGFGRNESFNLKISPQLDGSIDLIIEVRANLERMAQTLLKVSEEEIRGKLGDNIYGNEGERLEEVVGYLLYLRGLKLALAESCTGGLLSSRITDVPGSSNYYLGGVIAYQSKIKTSWLDVPPQVIEKFGEVSQQTAIAMARGAAKLLEANLGLAITGFAGPQGKQVGLVYIALAWQDEIKVQRFNFSGERKVVKEKATCAALDMIRRSLLP